MLTRRAFLLLLPGLILPLLLACANDPAPAGPPGADFGGDAGDSGAIAYLDADGCIAWVRLRDGARGTHCPDTRGRVTALTWLDADTIAYVTPELARLGWRGLRISTGAEFALDPVAESPRIYQVGAPQFYSVLGERIDIVDGSAAWTSADGSERRVLLAPGAGRGPLAMVTWSPDGAAVLLAEGAHKALWVVDRAGAARRIAAASAGFASWFVPAAGAMPHADLTCTLPTEFTYRCQAAPWQPADGAPSVAGDEILLSWSACPGVTGYELEVVGPTGEVVHRRVSSVQAQRFTPPGPGDYTWRVRTRIGAEPTAWSAPRTLRVR